MPVPAGVVLFAPANRRGRFRGYFAKELDMDGSLIVTFDQETQEWVLTATAGTVARSQDKTKIEDLLVCMENLVDG